MAMNIDEFLGHAHQYGERLPDYTKDDLGIAWNVLKDQESGASWACVTRCFKVVGRDASKPHTVLISYSKDMASGEGSYVGWCGDAYCEGRMSSKERGARLDEATRFAMTNFGGEVIVGLRQKLDAGYGHVQHKSSGCDFWRKRANGGCKHMKMVLAAISRADLEELRAEYDTTMNIGTQEAESFGVVDKIGIIERSAFVAPLMIIGPPSTSKTHTVREFVESDDVYYIESGCHEGTEAVDLLGFTQPHMGDWVWRDGPVSEAFRKAARGIRVVLLLDELLCMRREERSALLSAFGEFKGRYTVRTGRILRVVDGVGEEETLSCATDHLFLVCTSNVGPGMDEISGPLKSRFKIVYFGATENTMNQALDEELGRKAWPNAEKERVRKAIDKLVKKSSQAAKSAALAAALDVRAIKRMLAGSRQPGDVAEAAMSESLQCVGLNKEGEVIVDHHTFYKEMVSKAFE